MGFKTPTPPPPLGGASGKQLVAKGAALKSPWTPKVPDSPWTRRRILSTLHPNTILELNSNADTHPNP